MTLEKRLINKNGIHKDNVFYKFHNNFVRGNKSDYYFEPTKEGQLYYMVYISLVYISNNDNQFCVPINKIIKSMGLVPQSGKGRTTDKVRQSFDRLERMGLIEIEELEKTYISGEVILPNIDTRFFQLYERNLKMIMNDLYARFNEQDKFISKYEDKAKAMYVYSYILSMMGKHKTTGDGYYEPTLCFPSFDKICKECNISRSYLAKLLAYFEYDGLIYTVNIGYIKSSYDNKLLASSNYYTNDLGDIPHTYIYAKAYYDNSEEQITYYDDRTVKKNILNDITEMMKQALELSKENEKLSEEDKKKAKFFKDDYTKFREHVILMMRNTILEFQEIGLITRDQIDVYVATKKYLKSIYYRRENKISPVLIAIANSQYGIEILNNMKNKTKALMYLYGVIK